MTRADNSSESCLNSSWVWVWEILNLKHKFWVVFALLTLHNIVATQTYHTLGKSRLQSGPSHPLCLRQPCAAMLRLGRRPCRAAFVLLFCFCCYCATTSSAHAKCKWQPHFSQPSSPLCTPSPVQPLFGCLFTVCAAADSDAGSSAATVDCNSDCAGTAWQVASRVQSWLGMLARWAGHVWQA